MLFTAKTVIGQLITFTIPLIILFFIMSGIASLPKNSGKLLGKTVALSYCSTILAGLFAFTVASNLIPRLTTAAEPTAESAIKLASYINLEIPPLFGVMSALAAAFVFGIGISATQATDLRRVADQGRDIIDRLLAKVIIPLLPFYIAGVFVEMTVEGTVFATLKTFGVVLVMAIVMHWLWLSVLFVGTGLALGRSPAQLIKNMLPAYFTALGTMSSAATIPVALQASKNNGVSDGIANFTVPLCATIHLWLHHHPGDLRHRGDVPLRASGHSGHRHHAALHHDAGCHHDCRAGCSGWWRHVRTGPAHLHAGVR